MSVVPPIRVNKAPISLDFSPVRIAERVNCLTAQENFRRENWLETVQGSGQEEDRFDEWAFSRR